MTAERTRTAREPFALARWLDVALVVTSVPVLLLAGLPALGVLAGGGVWILQRLATQAIDRRAARADSAKTYTGLMLASSLGRAWVVGLTILGVGLAGSREDGLVAAVIVLAAFTVYFVLALFLRPNPRSSQSS